MIRIGLTGGIASGKSTVATWLKEMGFPLIDADQIARDVVRPGEEGLVRLVARFGRGVLHADGSLDRGKLGRLVFADQEKRKELNALLHPLIRRRMRETLDALQAQGLPVVFLDIPLLFESGLEDWTDRSIVVYVPQPIQLKRLMERNQLGEEEAMARIRAQMPLAEKRKMATAVIDNSGPQVQTHEQLRDLLKSWDLI
ncbi:dephospho-CoA kinase [Sporolactobacillus spathodeae]|uniref:Dephospho-CoA kinase n=2 Tax=Sporolactobacillus spathodeae TaxID=1465502 RepID=A0ABS2QAG9_9BACL|nr:dephospho-CoA kinase [Sporolactobacillus spathodeae]MBM7658723.1 dephospho-CoA kinase [Sporolactobacillus spathodeae]